jgi:hypothetical protein
VGKLRKQFEMMTRKYERKGTLGRPRRRYEGIIKIGEWVGRL